MELLAAENPDREPLRRGKSSIEIFKSQGFGGLRAIGGLIEVGQKPFQVVHRPAIYAPGHGPGRWRLGLPQQRRFPAPALGAPRRDRLLDLYFDVLSAFDHVGPLFDEVYGDGDRGMWQSVLRNLKDASDGPRVDLRNELIARLGSRITVVSDYVLPITPGSQRLLFAVEARDEKAVARAPGEAVTQRQEAPAAAPGRARALGGHCRGAEGGSHDLPERRAAAGLQRRRRSAAGPGSEQDRAALTARGR